MDSFSVKIGHELRIIHIKSLLAVEVDDYLCKLHIENEPVLSCVESLRNILSKLPDSFVRISRNCIINTIHVKSIHLEKREVKLSGNKTYHFSVRNTRILKNFFSANH